MSKLSNFLKISVILLRVKQNIRLLATLIISVAAIFGVNVVIDERQIDAIHDTVIIVDEISKIANNETELEVLEVDGE